MIPLIFFFLAFFLVVFASLFLFSEGASCPRRAKFNQPGGLHYTGCLFARPRRGGSPTVICSGDPGSTRRDRPAPFDAMSPAAFELVRVRAVAALSGRGGSDCCIRSFVPGVHAVYCGAGASGASRRDAYAPRIRRKMN